jgi:hypothetical protein
MTNLDALKKYFLSGTAEEERQLLDRMFTNHEQMADVLDMSPGTIRIVVGNKGTGKTALVEWIRLTTNKNLLPALLIRPDDLDLSLIPNSADLSSLKRGFYFALLKAVASTIGSRLSGYISGSNTLLHTEAVAQGLSEDDFVQRILKLLSSVAAPVAKVNGTKLAKELSSVAQPAALIRAINNSLLSDPEHGCMLLLLDDTDQTAAPSDPGQLNRVWALLLALRRLSGECPAIRCVATLRTEVWSRLQIEDRGQRDQTDHLRNLVVTLRASDEFIRRLIQKRLTLAATEVQLKGNPYTHFFDGEDVALPTSSERRPWDVFIAKSSRERPRDAIQLVRRLVDCAKSNNRNKIGDREAGEGMKAYSRERVEDLASEFAADCSSLQNIVESFASLDFELGFEPLRTHLKSVPSRFSNLRIRTRAIRSGNDDDAVHLLHFLHETGFVNPRTADAQMPRGFKHTSFTDNPHFVTMNNWNALQAATWEIHPAFRSHLIAMRKH